MFFPPRAKGDKPSPAHLVDALETWLAGLGYVMTGRLRAALQALSTQRLEAAGKFFLKTLSGSLGARDDHEPLFRRFPRGVPKDTWKLYVERVVVHYFQEPDQPCLLCDNPSEKGGRVHGIFIGYRACWDIDDRLANGDKHFQDTPVSVVEGESLSTGFGDRRIQPGETGGVRMHPLRPEFWCRLHPARDIRMHEGACVVGHAVVKRVGLTPPF